MLLQPNPPHVIMPSEVELADAGDRSVGSWNKSMCLTCGGTGSFLGYAPGTFAVEEYECDCVEQMVLHRWFKVRGITTPMQRLRWVDMSAVPPSITSWVYTYVETASYQIANGNGFVFSGGTGTGKSGMANLVVKALLLAGRDAQVIHASNFMDGVNGWRDPERRERFMHRLVNAQVLLYDALGREVASGVADKPRADEVKSSFAVERMLRDRSERGLTTLFTTNLDKPKMKQMYSSDFMETIERACIFQTWSVESSAHDADVRRAATERDRLIRRQIVMG